MKRSKVKENNSLEKRKFFLIYFRDIPHKMLYLQIVAQNMRLMLNLFIYNVTFIYPLKTTEKGSKCKVGTLRKIP